MTPIRQNYISIRSVLPYITIPRTEWDEDLAIEYAAQAYNTALGIKSSTYDEKIALLKLENFKAKLPQDFRKVQVVAYMWDQPTNTEVKGFSETDPVAEITENPVTDYEYDYNAAHIARIQNQGIVNNYNLYTGLLNSIVQQKKFTLLRPLSTPFTQKQHCTWCPNLSSTCDDTYTITKDGTMISSIEEGYVCVSYLGEPIDENGDLLILDDSDIQNALATYVMFKLWETKMHMHEEQAVNIRLMYLNEWEKLAMKIKGKLNIKNLNSKAIAAYRDRFHNLMQAPSNWNNTRGIVI